VRRPETNKPKSKASRENVLPTDTPTFVKTSAITIRYPLLWLSAAILIVYSPTFSMGLVDLDDGIFINTFRDYNENLHNLVTSFFRSAYGTSSDIFYRPIPVDTIILNYHLGNHGPGIFSFHLVNVLFHLIAVLLLYDLFKKLGVRELHAFILTLLFAVHPALVMAVAWIPARNETLLAIFIFSFLIYVIRYTGDGK